MLKHHERDEVHYCIVLDLAIRSLERDYATLEMLKMAKIYVQYVDGMLKPLRQDYHRLKNKLKRHKIRIVGWKPLDHTFIQYTIATSGEDVELLYAKQALHYAVEQELMKRIGNHQFVQGK